MDTLTIIFLTILFVASVILIVEARPFYSRKHYLHQNPDEEPDRIARREALREFHRLRRERERVWFSMDKMHDQLVQSTSSEKPAIEPTQSDSPPQMSDSKRDS
jgi:hypothetical protein